jgi:hypothetical protein
VFGSKLHAAPALNEGPSGQLNKGQHQKQISAHKPIRQASILWEIACECHDTLPPPSSASQLSVEVATTQSMQLKRHYR